MRRNERDGQKEKQRCNIAQPNVIRKHFDILSRAPGTDLIHNRNI
jgi:hypothetical protein